MKRLMRMGLVVAAALSIVASSGAAAARTYEDTNAKIIYGGTWPTWINGVCSKSTCHYNTAPTDTITISTFTGDYLDIAYIARANGSIMTVTIDGVAQPDLDTWSGSGDTRVVVSYALAGHLTHTAVIGATGTANAASVGTVFYFDDVKVRHIA